MEKKLIIFLSLFFIVISPLAVAAFPGDYTPMELARDLRQCQHQESPCVGIFDTSRPRYMDMKDNLIIWIFLLVSITYLFYKQKSQLMQMLILLIRPFLFFCLWLIIPLIVSLGLFQLLDKYLDNLPAIVAGILIMIIVLLPVALWAYLDEIRGKHNQGGEA